MKRPEAKNTADIRQKNSRKISLSAVKKLNVYMGKYCFTAVTASKYELLKKYRENRSK